MYNSPKSSHTPSSKYGSVKCHAALITERRVSKKNIRNKQINIKTYIKGLVVYFKAMKNRTTRLSAV
jgi:hypothetical protein